MKRIIFISFLFITVMATDAMAACTDKFQARLVVLLGDKTVCKADGSGGFEWQEYHKLPNNRANNLIDYKKGPTDPVDPTKAVGRWVVAKGGSPDATITYNYGPGAVYTYKVHGPDGGPFSFCDATTGQEVVGGAYLVPGQGPC